MLLCNYAQARNRCQEASKRLAILHGPPHQEMLLSEELPREERIDREVPADVIERLSVLGEFARAYEPDGMTPKDFIAYGATQKTLAQFDEGGWKLLENFG